MVNASSQSSIDVSIEILNSICSSPFALHRQILTEKNHLIHYSGVLILYLAMCSELFLRFFAKQAIFLSLFHTQTRTHTHTLTLPLISISLSHTISFSLSLSLSLSYNLSLFLFECVQHVSHMSVKISYCNLFSPFPKEPPLLLSLDYIFLGKNYSAQLNIIHFNYLTIIKIELF